MIQAPSWENQVLATDKLPSYLQEAIASLEFAPGQTVYHQGDTAVAIYRVKSGRIRLIRHTVEGRVVTFRVVRPGEIFAETDLYAEVYQCDAISDLSSEVVAYPKESVLRALHDQPELAQDLIHQLNDVIRALKLRLELLAVRSAGDRILEYLRFTQRPNQSTIHFDRPYKDIASDLGLSPEVFYRTLSRLEKEGSIARNKRDITLLRA